MGWEPVPGYCNYNQDSPAMSDDPNSWPAHWPDKPSSWDGYWNGYFGKGVKNADLETYFVMDDSRDTRWHFYPDSTDTTRRGSGFRVAVRGFQWSHVLAQDCIFWHFEVINEGTRDYDKCLLGMYVDWGIGECMPNPGGSDDAGSYDTKLDLAYAWQVDRLSQWGGPSGYAGFAYLETPGNPWDGIDNDEDGLTDERRDSGPGEYIYGPCGYYREDGSLDPEERLQYRWHWSGDEDGDWRPYTDLNGNNKWDYGEPLNDDLGADGIGPMDEGYTGPDEGEGDGIPTAGEPNFDQTDKDESDQIGLTGFKIIPCHDLPFTHNEEYWQAMSQLTPPTTEQLSGVNLTMHFASGPFEIHAGESRFFSMALLFGEDYDDLTRTKNTVQAIYNANYRFAQPPYKPTVKAVAGDRKVILFWDDKAERSFDRYLQEYDFEGYRVYRSTDPSFLDQYLITDSYGHAQFRKPIAQFDLKNGIKGPHLIGIQGAHFNLGDDTGLQHFFIDTTVENGQTYYYAVVSYDRGYIERDTAGNVQFDDEGNPMGISPSECTSNIMIDESGEVKRDINTVVVTPNAPAAGYIPPEVVDDKIEHYGPGTGRISVNIIDPSAVKSLHTYQIIFSDTTPFHNQEIPSYSVIDITSSPPETLLAGEIASFVGAGSHLFDGLVISVFNDPTVICDSTGWRVKQNNYNIKVGLDPTFTSETNPFLNLNIFYPADYELSFHDTIVATSSSILGFRAIPTNFAVWNVTDSTEAQFLFKDKNKDSLFSIGDAIIILTRDPSHPIGWRTTWELTLEGPPATYDTIYYDETDSIIRIDTVWVEEPVPPQPGDIFYLHTTKPFRGNWVNDDGDTLRGDIFQFTMKAESYSEEKAKIDMEKIAVVPNPYVVAARWEPPNPYAFGRGERKIQFIHLPKECTIRIYTIRGNLVKEIKHNAPITDGAETWNLISQDGMDVAYGVYIYHVHAPGIGDKIGKFVLIK